VFEKMQLKKEWRLSERIRRNGFGSVVDRDFLLKVADHDEGICTIIHPSEKIVFNTEGKFYGFAQRSLFQSVHVIPDELLQFEICSYNIPEHKTAVTIKKICSNEYSVEIYAKEFKGSGYYCPEQNVKELLNKEMLLEKLKHIPGEFQVFPFLYLPFGNCFNCES